MRLALIGPGDTEFHFHKTLKIPKNQFYSELGKIAQSLVNTHTEIEFLPDRGISFELAKIYKQKGGKNVVGSYPKSDKNIGVKHLQPYLETKINNNPLFDQLIDTQDWFKHDLIKGLLGNAILYLGDSPGTEIERNGSIYLYKLMKGQNLKLKYIHPKIKANKNFTIYAYKPFLSKPFSKESEAYMKKFGIKLKYINSPQELEKELIKNSCTNTK